ncbi:hypothetical protein [Microcoleus sp. bin38.metabat.b11b12b14.051]|uniref:hypothetical protein n=1 Tax=Microcoleus sp. bin38.metabat.b11b12b14.051 TaxID=2742709 RepID=UPI00345A0CC1
MALPTIALTPQQTALIPMYRHKWWQIGRSIARWRSPAGDSSHQHRLQHHRLRGTGNYFW